MGINLPPLIVGLFYLQSPLLVPQCPAVKQAGISQNNFYVSKYSEIPSQPQRTMNWVQGWQNNLKSVPDFQWILKALIHQTRHGTSLHLTARHCTIFYTHQTRLYLCHVQFIANIFYFKLKLLTFFGYRLIYCCFPNVCGC